MAYDKRGWEFKLPIVPCSLSSGQLRGKDCLLPTFVLNPVTGCICSRHPCAGGFQSRRLEPLRLELLEPGVVVIHLPCC